jgi:hypothetical protein
VDFFELEGVAALRREAADYSAGCSVSSMFFRKLPPASGAEPRAAGL